MRFINYIHNYCIYIVAAPLSIASSSGDTVAPKRRKVEAASFSIAGGSAALATTRGLRLDTYIIGAITDRTFSGPSRHTLEVTFKRDIDKLLFGGIRALCLQEVSPFGAKL